MRYFIPGASIDKFPGCIPERLRRFGPWSAQPDSSGVTLTAREWPTGNYTGEPRKTPEGWDYWHSDAIPSLQQLLRAETLTEACNQISLICGISLLVRPAYLEPRRVFSNGTVGDAFTEHGRRARRVGDLLRADDPQGIRHPEAITLWLEAVGNVYRATPEVIDDLAIFSFDDVDAVIAAVFAGPKLQPGAGISPLPSPG